jgi:hypothetical protein
VTANAKVFFSHASEDKPIVRQVLRLLTDTYPEVEPWLDEFEIISGQSLLEKIGQGMDASEKFLIFLSPTSIRKPWVLAELRDALTLDIQGVKPDFVIPVIVEGLETLPPFLRDKKHIDLTKLTQDKWLPEMKAAIDGRFADRKVEDQPNLLVRRERHTSRPNLGTLVFYANFWAERLALQIETSAPILAYETSWRVGGFRGGYTEHHALLESADGSRFGLNVARRGELLSPKEEFELRYRMPKGVDAFASFIAFRKWDGSGHSSTFEVLPFSFGGDGASDLPRLPQVDDED